ncbi:WD40-like Beta Propeller [Macleaya cordata]|uniref:WD40-like Beta Propeller n=1 Tax=Macleaya cordata TaxID=56857 RepID=A0A200QXZ9_MACCD|nr:WD40-like Beta Propeller [Macleaya cordata]
MANRSSSSLFLLLLHLLIFSSSSMAKEDKDEDRSSSCTGSIVFATLGRANYAFDIFTLPISPPKPNNNNHDQKNELQITDGKSVNFNGFFASPTSPSILSLLSNQSLLTLINSTSSPTLQLLIYVTERDGSSNIYLDAYYYDESSFTKINNNPSSSSRRRSRSALEETFSTRVQIPLLQEKQSNNKNNKISTSKIVSMKDRPSISGEFLIYVSTRENSQVPRKSWAAVYSTHLKTGETQRLTPSGVADFSPAVSPSGIWTAVASSGEKGWDGEIEDLNTHIYIFRTSDGSNRIKVVDHGGWPCWIDDSTFYFHRSSDDGWWSVYKATLPPTTNTQKRTIQNDSVRIERVTPPGLHAFTPAVSVKNKRFIAMATRRPTSDFRHIELFDLTTNQFVELTRNVSPKTHHFNPFFSFDGTQIGYHRCRGSGNGEEKKQLLLENIQCPSQEISLFRIDGSFPSFSPNGDRIAYAGFPGLYVVNRDGSGKREIFSGAAFSTAWDWKRKGVVYASTGPTFASESTQVDIISVTIHDDDDKNGRGMDGIANNSRVISSSKSSVKKLTTGGQNNAFPSPSPDGKWVVFRSGRSGHKNLYVMDALEGEKGGIYRLTEGPWTDTMCNWSPNGEWIAFASDRENPGGGSYEIFFIHPNGTGLKKVVHSGEGGRTNHPWFSPGSDHIVFTTDYAAVSAEPIANPHHYQPYGDIFIARADGSEMQRMTHNSYEDGTPAWGPTFMKPVDVVEWPSTGSSCSFDDCHWLGQSTPNIALGGVPPKHRC